MKCEVCLRLLEEYVDGELGEPEAAPLSAHLITCAGCAGAFEALTAEQEVYSRYDRELTIAPATWGNVAARTTKAVPVSNSDSRFRWRDLFAVPALGWSRWHGRPARVRAFAGAIAVLMLALVIGIVYLRTQKQPATPEQTVKVIEPRSAQGQQNPADLKTTSGNPSADNLVTAKNRHASTSLAKRVGTPIHPKKAVLEQSDVLFSDAAYSTIEERDTQRHIEQAQNLLRSVRNIQVGEEDEIDVSFEKALARRLLNENVVLRRDAEMSGKFPVKMLLSDLEPFLIDIANLPDNPAPDDLRVLKERVLKTEIVAALQGY
jgi:anti-sigma factor RsiW